MSNTTSWQRTQVQGLLRNRGSGIYYGRWILSGKQKWKSLKTDVFTVAKLRLIDVAANSYTLSSSAANQQPVSPLMGNLISGSVTQYFVSRNVRRQLMQFAPRPESSE